MKNALYYGDNLAVLKEHIADESVDLIYLDPPFNSNRSYNVLFKDESGSDSDAQITAFDDAWHWGKTAEQTYQGIIQNAPINVANMIGALRGFIGSNQMMAYLVMMAARLVELRRVLKSTGSLYLHCDPTASHYLKIVLDIIFGIENFRNEITWKRSSTHSDAKKFANISDVLFLYTKSSNYLWNEQFTDYDEQYLKSHYSSIDSKGRRYTLSDLNKPKGSTGYFYQLLGCQPPPNGWRMPQKRANQWINEGRIIIPSLGKTPRYIRYLDEVKGRKLGNIWTDISPVNSQAVDNLGFPTQKPLALLERIIQASSNPGDIVLDPFSGCGTAIAAAQKLGRQWIGIDITHLAIAMHKARLLTMFGLQQGVDYDVIGEPVDLSSAHQLARESRYQFQWWALSLIEARPLGDGGGKTGKKGSDRGIDGAINFLEDRKGTVKRALVQVKSGHVKSGDIRDLKGVLDREQAQIGIFLTLESPTSEMTTEAVSAGYYHSDLWQKDYPRIQILTVEEILAGKKPDIPPTPRGSETFKQAGKVKKIGPKQGELDI